MSETAFEFILPDLGEGIGEAEIRRWLVAEGDRVEEHQSVAEIETDKAVVEIPSPRSGTVLRLARRAGELVRVGEVLMVIGQRATVSLQAPEEERPPAYGIVGELPAAEDLQPVEKDPPAPQVRALPAVRALARKKGVDLAALTGSGPQGSITREDVLAVAGGGISPPPGTRRLPLRGLRRSIARHLLEAQQRTAFVTTMAEADVTALWGLKQREAAALQARGLHLTFLPFFMKAVQHALLEFPRLNATVDEEREELVLEGACHMGVAVDSEEGLLVPVVRDVGQKSVVRLAEELQALAARAETRSLEREGLQGSTFTISNFGAVGGRFATPVINHPNVAILACGAIAERPWVVAGQVVPRRILPLSLTFDHRVVDGAEATRFLLKAAHYLEDPGLLFIESV